MAWRTIVIENPASLSIKNRQLIIKNDNETSLPIEDIDTLIIDSYGVKITTNALVELSSNSTSVIFCDNKHLPNSVLVPYEQHSRQAKIAKTQINTTEPLKKRLWQKIIQQKITSQSDVLKKLNLDFADLLNLIPDVKSGDTTNRESIAARIYFDKLLKDATRRKPLWHNSALNYGYAIVRGCIARHIASRGLISSCGIFHRSELNSFNLADDLIETLRPIVDYFILTKIAPLRIGSDPSDSSLTKEERNQILDILNYNVTIGIKRYSIKHAIDIEVESFVKSISNQDIKCLLLPKL
jgi:CRISPR-associated protein Cas1